jgi:hypothetical protein
MSGPQPTPVPAPTPTPDVSHVRLPNAPSNAYQLLSSLSDAIDTANGNFKAHATKLAGISHDTNGAVTNVTSTSQSNATSALSDVWKNTQTDFSSAHDSLTAVTANNCMGGSPNPLRVVLDQNKSTIQDGLIAMANIQAMQRDIPLPQPPSAQQVEEWIQEVNALANSLGNVNLALEAMIITMRGIKGGLTGSCATGFVPGFPPPTFPPNAFASKSSGPSGGGSVGDYKSLEANLIKNDHIDPATAESIAFNAELEGLDPNDVQALINTGANPDEVLSLLEDGKITKTNVSDITLLTNRGGDLTQITTRLQGMDADQLALLRNRAAQNPKLGADDLMQLTDPTLKYDPNPKHDVVRPGVSPQPANGQLALDNSVTYKSTTTSRVGIDPRTGDIVVLDDTNNGMYHGHIETWSELDQNQQNALMNDGFIDKRGRIILRDSKGNIIGYGRNVKK